MAPRAVAVCSGVPTRAAARALARAPARRRGGGGRARRARVDALPGKPLREQGDDEGLELPEGVVEAEFKDGGEVSGESGSDVEDPTVAGAAGPAQAEPASGVQAKVQAVLEEVKLIEWPSPGQVASSTAVVFGVLITTSLAMLGVNYGLSSVANALFEGGSPSDSSGNEAPVRESPAAKAKRVEQEAERLGLADAADDAAGTAAPPVVIDAESAFPDTL